MRDSFGYDCKYDEYFYDTVHNLDYKYRVILDVIRTHNGYTIKNICKECRFNYDKFLIDLDYLVKKEIIVIDNNRVYLNKKHIVLCEDFEYFDRSIGIEDCFGKCCLCSCDVEEHIKFSIKNEESIKEIDFNTNDIIYIIDAIDAIPSSIENCIKSKKHITNIPRYADIECFGNNIIKEVPNYWR